MSKDKLTAEQIVNEIDSILHSYLWKGNKREDCMSLIEAYAQQEVAKATQSYIEALKEVHKDMDSTHPVGDSISIPFYRLKRKIEELIFIADQHPEEG